MFLNQRGSRTAALLPMLAVLLVFSMLEQTALSLETTAAPVATNSSLSLNNSTPSALTGRKSHRPCGSDMVDFCANGGQCVYYQDHETPSCECQSPFEGHRCLTMAPTISKCQRSDSFRIVIIVGVSIAMLLLAIIIFCCFRKRCVKSALLKESTPKIEV